MTTTTLRGLLAVLFAAVLVAGCGTTDSPEVILAPDEPDPMEMETPVEPPDQPTFVGAPDRFDAFGNPIDEFGNPLVRTIYFDFDESILLEQDIPLLRLHAEVLRDFPDRTIVVEGHCDERGTREYNLALGERRADSVRSFLIANGVRRGQIESVSYGEEQPVDPGHDEIAWSKNRRAEISYQ